MLVFMDHRLFLMNGGGGGVGDGKEGRGMDGEVCLLCLRDLFKQREDGGGKRRRV